MFIFKVYLNSFILHFTYYIPIVWANPVYIWSVTHPIEDVINAFKASVNHGPVANTLNIPSNHNPLKQVAANISVTIGTHFLFKSCLVNNHKSVDVVKC